MIKVDNNQLMRAREYCRKRALSHYENFTVGSFLLPPKLRQHIYNVYTYCRISDDLADEQGSPQESLKKLEDWGKKLIACYKGENHHPVFIALRQTIDEFSIPIEPFHNLLFAFIQDQTIKRYDTFDQLLGYCENSANPVGRIYLYLFRLATSERFHYSDQVCTALQLTNFWQDVTVDLQKQRIYIPIEDLTRFHCNEQDLQTKSTNPQVKELIAFQVNRTQRIFDEGKEILNLLSNRPKFEIALFIRGGESILRKIRQQEYDILKSRPAINKFQKFNLILKTLISRGSLPQIGIEEKSTIQEIELAR